MNNSIAAASTAALTPPTRFSLGTLVATPGALAALVQNDQSGTEFLNCHAQGDWGEVCRDHTKANDDSVSHGNRLLSAYPLNDQTRIWIITEADRSSTCILLPEEY